MNAFLGRILHFQMYLEKNVKLVYGLWNSDPSKKILSISANILKSLKIFCYTNDQHFITGVNLSREIKLRLQTATHTAMVS